MAMIRNPNPGLTFDGLDLLGPNEFGGYTFELAALAPGFDLGSPSAIVTWVTGVLKSGAVASVNGYGVREASIVVRVTGDTSLQLAAGETALSRACGKRTTLLWTPPDEWGPTSVLDVLNAELQPATDDTLELHLTRHYTLKLSLHPFARSVEPVTVTDDSTVTAESSAVRNNGSSASGWTGSGTTPSVVSGKVRTTVGGQFSRLTMWLQQASIDLTDTGKPYLRVKWDKSNTTAATSNLLRNQTVTAVINGVTVTPSAQAAGLVWFPIPDFTSGPVRFVVTGDTKDSGVKTNYALNVDEVAVTNISGPASGRQKQFSLEVRGAAPTEAALTVSHPTDGLGDVLLYTYPADRLGPDYQPILYGYRTAGGTRTTDTSLVSGTREPIGTSSNRPIYTIPANDLPEGTFTVVLRARTTGTAGRRSIGIYAEVGGVSQTGSATVTFATTNVWQMVTLVRIDHPNSLMPGSTKSITLRLDNSDGDVQLDAAWLCHADGALTIVPAGSELSVTVAPATVDEPRERVFAGDMFAAAALSWDTPAAAPPQISGIVAVTGGTSPAVEATYFPRWVTHAME